jgi:hypothetical protein
MKHGEALIRLHGYTPTGNEAVDVDTLYAIVDQIGALKFDADVRRELIMIFERNPGIDLGSPGPIVHTLEESPIDEHVDLLTESLKRGATIMTVWMAERCFRSNLSDRNRIVLLDALRDAVTKSKENEIAISIHEALSEYGK